MMHAQEKMPDLDPSGVLSMQLFAPSSTQNILTVHSDGRATLQPGFGAKEMVLRLDLGRNGTVEEFLQRHLPIQAFWSLDRHENYYEIPSPRTSGTAANLYLRHCQSGREKWIGIWNYGRGDIPESIDANMFKAVLKLVEYLTEG